MSLDVRDITMVKFNQSCSAVFVHFALLYMNIMFGQSKYLHQVLSPLLLLRTHMNVDYFQ